MARPSKWKRSTKMMRFPTEFEGQLTEIAHRLDNGEAVSSDSELEEAISEILKTIPPGKRSYVSRLFNRLLERMKKPAS